MDQEKNKENLVEPSGSSFEKSLDAGSNPDLENLENAETVIIDPANIPQTSKHKIAPSPSKQPDWAGKILGHFKLLRLIGQGNMGRVIQAKDINLQRIVALKILNKRVPGLDQEERVNQFLREARAAAQIDHPNVVRIYEINHHKGWWYIAMEMLEGQNLRRVVQAAGPLSPAKASAVIADAAAGLAVAHEIGIIHRDVKPTNLMFSRNGRCKLTDFGLVRIDDPNDPFDFTDKAVGSPHFIAPEIILRRKQTPAVDIYSLGATLYFALTGSPPYSGTTLKQILKQHIEAPIPDVRTLRPECPATIALLIKRAMSKNPNTRPSAADIAAALRAEAITSQTETSGSILYPGIEQTATLDKSVVITKSEFLEHTKKQHRRWIYSTAAALIFTIVVIFALLGPPWSTDQQGKLQISELSRSFPNASGNYGILPEGSIPGGANSVPKNIPEFSWVGKIDTSSIKFVASKSGLYYYPVDSPRAALISVENFVGYANAREAQADGKKPAP